MTFADLWMALDRAGFETMRALFSVLWQSSILLGAAGLLALALRRRSAAARQTIWAVAIVLTPLLPILAHLATSAAVPQAPIPVMPEYAAPQPVIPVAPPPMAPVRAWSPLDYPWAMALLAYAAGAATLMTLVLVGRFRIGRWLRRGRVVTDAGVLAVFESARTLLALEREFTVVESSAVHAPLAIGTLHPAVLLPTVFAAGLSQAELQAVAIHELSHVKRRDAPLLAILSCVRAALWFHPLVWLACRQVSTLAEQACDDRVLDATGEPVSYARLLARLAEELPRRALGMELAAGVVFSKGALLKRVEAILSHRRDQIRRLSRAALAATVLGAIVSVAVALALPLADKPASAPEAPTAAQPVEEGPLGTAEAFLAAVAAGKEGEAIRLTAPGSAVPRQMGDFRNIPNLKDLKIARVHADDAAGLAATGPFELERKSKKETVLLQFEMRTAGARWVISDIDLRSPRDAQESLERFLKGHPKAVEISVAASAEVEAAWGAAVEGVQVRLRAQKKVWLADESPVLVAAVRNNGKHNQGVGMNGITGWEIQVDGECFGGPFITAWPDTLAPGEGRDSIVIQPTSIMDGRPVWNSGQGRGGLVFSAGKHIIRVALSPSFPASPILSNPVEIEILPAEPKLPALLAPTALPPSSDVYIMGEVDRPGVYSLAVGKFTVRQLLTAAGYRPSGKGAATGTLVRRLPNNLEQRLPLDITAIIAGTQADLQMQADDLVIVDQVPSAQPVTAPPDAGQPSAVLTKELAERMEWVSSAVKTASDFVGRLRNKKIDDAYKLTTEDYRQNHKGLAIAADRLDFSKAMPSRVGVAVEAAFVILGPVPSPQGDVAVGLGMLRFGGDWLIRDVDLLPTAEAAKKFENGFTQAYPNSTVVTVGVAAKVEAARQVAEQVKARVEDYFRHNYRDITARQTLEWGEVQKEPNGNLSIRYKYRATIRDKGTFVIEEQYTFGPDGQFVSVKSLSKVPAVAPAPANRPAGLPENAAAQLIGTWRELSNPRDLIFRPDRTFELLQMDRPKPGLLLVGTWELDGRLLTRKITQSP